MHPQNAYETFQLQMQVSLYEGAEVESDPNVFPNVFGKNVFVTDVFGKNVFATDIFGKDIYGTDIMFLGKDICGKNDCATDIIFPDNGLSIFLYF